LPAGIRRAGDGKLIVDVQERFPDGTAFRRTREFAPDAMRSAQEFLKRSQAEFARGNGAGEPDAPDGVLTVAAWCEYCLSTAMPAQRNERKPKYSDEVLEDFRQVVRAHVVPGIGKVRLDQLDKKAVSDFIASLPTDDTRAKTLYVLTRVMELAESKGKRKKGTNPCKGVSLGKMPPQESSAGGRASSTRHRPSNWRDQAAE
jgi:hypothetical protein